MMTYDEQTAKSFNCLFWWWCRQFMAQNKEKEHFIASSQTGLYDRLTAKLFCKFLNFFTSPLTHERNEHLESYFVLCCYVVTEVIKSILIKNNNNNPVWYCRVKIIYNWPTQSELIPVSVAWVTIMATRGRGFSHIYLIQGRAAWLGVVFAPFCPE